MRYLKTLYIEYFFAFLIFMMGVSLSCVASLAYQHNHRLEVLRQFQEAATDRIESLRGFIEYTGFTLKSVNALYQSSEDVSRTEFTDFTTPLLEDHNYIRSIAWAPRIKGAGRAATEKKLQAEFPDFAFTRKNEDGKLEPDEAHEEYFPILYSQPSRTIEQGLGFNITSDKERSETLAKLLDTGKSQVSSLVHFIYQNDPNDTKGVIFYAPIFGENADQDKIIGVIASGLSLRSMVEAAIKPLKPQGVNIIIQDLSAAPDEERFLFTRSTRLRNFTNEEIIADYERGDSLRESASLDIGERRWQISVVQAPGFYSTAATAGSFAVLLAGLGFTFLLTFYIVSVSREKDRVNKQVLLRTRELNEAKQKTDLILLSTHEGILGLDDKGTITFCNPRAAEILGWNRREMTGSNFHVLLKPMHGDKLHTVDDCCIAEVIRNGVTTSDSDHSLITRKGNYIPVDLTASPTLEDNKPTGAVVVFHDITERKKYEAHLQNLAERDQMTGLYNRRSFNAALATAVTKANAGQSNCAVIYMDLNGFKKINDEMGHEAGDMMIKAFAERINAVMRDSDTVARLGGDEFAVVCHRIEKESDCLSAIERLLTNLAAQPVMIGGRNLYISSSVGVAFCPQDADDAEKLLAAADKAMYTAKKNKQLRYVTYKQALESGAVEQD